MAIITRIICIAFCFFKVTLAYAEPAPFGIKIKETNISDIKSKYKHQDNGVNKYSKGQMLFLDPKQFDFEGLQEVLLIFGQDDKVLAILTRLNKNRYRGLFNMLSNKYKLVKNKKAFVGDQNAEFKDDNTKIFLEAPHLSFSLNMNYIHNDLNNLYLDRSTQEKEEKAKQELGNL